MRWEATVASSCRYGDVAGRIFRDAEIIWENSESDYQGFANVLAHMPDGTFAHYEWTYGSCSGCDEWEARDLTDEQVEAEMRSALAVLPDKEALMKYLHLDPVYTQDMKYPTANTPTNASVPGMMRYLCGGQGEDFKSMAMAAAEYLLLLKGD
jgi:hypothetical protein